MTTKISEAIRDVQHQNAVTVSEMLEFLTDNVRDVTLLKILFKPNRQDGLKTYNVYHSGNDVFRPNNQSNVTQIFMPVQLDFTEETRQSIVVNDLNALIHHDNSWGALPVLLQLPNQQPKTFDIIFEDRTNVIYLVSDLDGTGLTWRDVRDTIDSITSLVHELNNDYDLSTDGIVRALGHVTEDDIANDPHVKETLLQFVPEVQHEQLRRQFNIGNDQAVAHTDDEPAEQTDTDGRAEDDDVIDLDTVDIEEVPDDDIEEVPDDEQDQGEQGQDEPVQPQSSDDKPEDGNADNADASTQDAGSAYLGEWQGENPGERTVVFGPYSAEEFQTKLSAYPATAVNALMDNKPYVYKQLANSEYKGVRVFGNSNGARKAFTDVCRNFNLFAFSSTSDIRWPQKKDGQEVFFRWNQGSTASDMWTKLSGPGNGNDFIGFFYGRCQGEYRRAKASGGSTVISAIWDANNASVGMQTSKSRTPASSGTERPKTDAQKRKFIVDQIERRLIAELAPAPYGHGGQTDYVKIPITKRSDTTQLLVGTPKHTLSRFGLGACRKLAQSYDDWVWPAPTMQIASRQIRNAINTLNAKLVRLLDPSTIELPPEKEVIKLSADDKAKLDRAMNAVNAKLQGTGIEVQISVPGHKPDYKYLPALGSKQGANWPTQGRYFVVMFTGLDTEKLFGDAATAYLRDTGLYKYVEPAFNEAKREYDTIQMAVVMDNGL